MDSIQPLLEVRELKKQYLLTKGFLRRVVGIVKAVDGVNFSISSGETLGLVGESGCGKTTVAKSVLRAIQPTDGEILFHDNGRTVDVASLEKEELKRVR